MGGQSLEDYFVKGQVGPAQNSPREVQKRPTFDYMEKNLRMAVMNRARVKFDLEAMASKEEEIRNLLTTPKSSRQFQHRPAAMKDLKISLFEDLPQSTT